MRAQQSEKSVKSRMKNATPVKRSKSVSRTQRSRPASAANGRVWPKLMATAAALGLSGAAYAYYRNRSRTSDHTVGDQVSTEAVNTNLSETTEDMNH